MANEMQYIKTRDYWEGGENRFRILLYAGWMSGKRSENLPLPRSRDGSESRKSRLRLRLRIRSS